MILQTGSFQFFQQEVQILYLNGIQLHQCDRDLRTVCHISKRIQQVFDHRIAVDLIRNLFDPSSRKVDSVEICFCAKILNQRCFGDRSIIGINILDNLIFRFHIAHDFCQIISRGAGEILL